MKIIQVRFLNLNSLRGEWQIDFTHPDYVAHGIFALTGPTGAGKTTILDAICLALYGRTPRLEKISKSVNEVMSRQTGECSAEVLFESCEGRFWCHWSHQRARKNPSGELQQPKHQISHENGEIIESKLSATQKAIVERVGMDFDRFTRSVLLAQGSFDAFLKASESEKATILEQITGTEIYTEISKMAYERASVEKETLRVLQSETSHLVLLSEEDEAVLREKQTERKASWAESSKQLTDWQAKVVWREALNRADREHQEWIEQGTRVTRELEEFSAQRVVLERAKQAATLDEAFATIEASRNQLRTDQTFLTTRKAALPGLKAAHEESGKLLRDAESCVAAAKSADKLAAPLFEEIRDLDRQIETEEKRQEELKSEHADMERERDAMQAALQTLQKNKAAAEKILEKSKDFLTTHQQDATLVGELSGMEAQLTQWADQQQQVARNQEQTTQAEKHVATAASLAEKAKKRSENAVRVKNEFEITWKTATDALAEFLAGATLRELRTQEDGLMVEISLREKIASLEEHRQALVDGSPCPLCGSEQHPFAEGNVPGMSEKQQQLKALKTRISHVEKAQDYVAAQKIEAKEIDNEIALANAAQQAAGNEHKAALNAQKEALDQLELARKSVATLEKLLGEKLKPLGVAKLPENADALMVSLRARQTAWNEQQAKKLATETKIEHFVRDEKNQAAALQKLSGELTKKFDSWTILSGEIKKRRDLRREKFGEKDVKKEQELSARLVEKSQRAFETAREKCEKCASDWKTANEMIRELGERIDAHVPQLEAEVRTFSQLVCTLGFADEDGFRAARLAGDARKKLEARALDLDGEKRDHSAHLSQSQTRLQALREKNLSELALAELLEKSKECEQTQQGLAEEVGSLSEQLKTNEDRKHLLQKKQDAILAQSKEWQRWERLNALIGQSDGQKFCRFAQGLTFELMISHANGQLSKMSERYRLVRDEEKPLELNVIDAFQSGEIRSIKNLSGGECFIVSLTLALGLSQMASRKVRVDSLFLDEGFGTLDPDSLDLALEALTSLHHEGKLIGIISHVVALKERIATQIAVIPGTQGRSTLDGAGCSKVK